MNKLVKYINRGLKRLYHLSVDLPRFLRGLASAISLRYW